MAFVPSAPAKDAPAVPKWNPPPATKENVDFAKLHTIDLSFLDSPDPAVVQQLIDTCKVAIKDDGFLYLTNYGVSLDQLMRQFDLANYMHNSISEEDKARLLWNPEKGTFAGYKHGFGWKRAKGEKDGIEQFNFYKPQFEDRNNLPACILPFMDEIEAFCNYMTTNVNRRLLKLLSLVLELPPDWLWDNIQSKGGPVADGYYRHALFKPVVQETNARQGMIMNGHTDYGTTTLLFSVPVSCLQIWGRDQTWRYVKYNPGALVVNIGDTLEIVSGGHFKATRHRVFRAPEDQINFERLSLVFFQATESSLRLSPAKESPLIQREGCVESQGVYKEYKVLQDSGVPVPTSKEWRESQVAAIREPAHNANFEVVEVNGAKMTKQTYHGVQVLLPL